MRISAEFIMSAGRIDQLPCGGLPEIALAGRSNVGKSSMINKLVGRLGLARTSNTPGRTQTLNYYKIAIDDASITPFYLVDMPGYGYAAVNKTSRALWKELIDQYLNNRDELCGIVQLVDLRHEPQPLDYTMTEWLHGQEHPFIVVANKSDKIAKGKVAHSTVEIAKALKVETENVIAFSAQTGLGRDRLWCWLLETVQGAGQEI